MKLLVFNTKRYDKQFFDQANTVFGLDINYLECHLDADTAQLARGYGAVCAFVNDDLGAATLRNLSTHGVKLIALRCAGYNNVDLKVAQELGLTTARVPAYSPHAVAEHTLALILALNRKVNRAHNRVREGNFALDGLLGFDLHGRTAGVVGAGKIGLNVTRILKGFGCEVLVFDPCPSDRVAELGARVVSMDQLLSDSDIISLHCPLTPQTQHLINAASIASMKSGVMLINTSRGGLVDTDAVIQGLKSGKIGYLGLDVYEMESELFFEDLSSEIIQDDTFQRLLTFPNVLITGHQGFFTEEAMQHIAHTTTANIMAFHQGLHLHNANFIAP